ncbi:CRISPR-associated endonuclease Cas2 [Nocardiopsis sp. RSe5-2]|uniref:CRISPR-associated endoribonuclease Cas2 n=1 Tax=Nocardiopsis endophytica TaxID=3018445 RepID=A0ABT4U1Y2_9ACTN|nr:CRISPR-associated endonuclease Cas2 [Nocardiopsis endophytica]MDA2810529.1 CRISPR-associated endonuclease Cas2 [Nocardiopsis endophytica]
MGTHPHRRRFYLVCYDIADDDRREEVSDLLSGYGPRVQYSVFEAAVTGPEAYEELTRGLRGLIEQDEDQVRIYPLRVPDLDKVTGLGNRRLEERDDFWIL